MLDEISKKTMINLFILLIILNVILRFQVVPHEVYPDSAFMHVMTNSLNEFGYAKWIIHPLSVVGLYPGSYTSSVQFFLSSISQSTNMEMESVIFLYSLFIGVFSMLTAYIMAKKIMDDSLFKFLVAFGFSTSLGVLGYTTWTIPARGLFVVLTPLFIYIMLKCRESLKYAFLAIIFAIFLFSTHHLFYFLVPPIFVFLLLTLCFRLGNIKPIRVPRKLLPVISFGGFLIAYSIPFLTRSFLEGSRYAPINISYLRYIGLPIFFTIGGLTYLIFKDTKKFEEWFLLLSLVSLVTFMYIQTYMKWFLPIFAIPLAALGLINLIKKSKENKFAFKFFVIILLLSTSISAYYQFVHFIPKSEEKSINQRYLEESTYQAGLWMRDGLNGSAISNDNLFGIRIFAISEKTHVFVDRLTINQIYEFTKPNISEFKRYPITTEEFWFKGYAVPPIGARMWKYINLQSLPYQKFGIKYLVENTRAGGNIVWHHGIYPSKLLRYAYDDEALLYNNGKVRIWELSIVKTLSLV